jgi:transcriptional regulator with XRE-family HTH domain
VSEVIVDGVRYLPPRRKTRKRRPLPQLLFDARSAKAESLETAAANMGTTKAHLWTMEQGECNPTLHLLQRMLDYYGIDYDEIERADP